MKTLKQIIADEPARSYSRVEALYGLMEISESDDGIFEYILSLKGDENPVFRLKWARLLSKKNDPRVAQAFVDALAEEDDPHVLKTMIKGLAKSGDLSCVEFLRPFLENESNSVRHAAKNTIAELEYVPEPPAAEPEEEEIVDTFKALTEKGRLPLRIWWKLFYRKYRLVIISLTFLLSMIPASMGIYYGAVKIKEVIVSFQPTAEELAEKERLEAERKLLEEQQRLEELKQLEEERLRKEELAKKRKPFNWGYFLKGAVIFILFGAVVFLFNKFFTVLDKLRFKAKGPTKYLPDSPKDKLNQKRTHQETVDKSVETTQENKAKPEDTRQEQALKESEKSTPQAEKDTPQEEEKKAEQKSRNQKEAAEDSESIDLTYKEEKEVISLSKRIIFSFFERFFRLFNNNYNKNILRIFIPNDLFYKIRFFTMLGAVGNFAYWVLAFILAVSFNMFMHVKGGFNINLLWSFLEPFKVVFFIVLFIVMFYGFFIANPFKMKIVNLYKLMSDYYYARKYYFRQGEQEQWAILLRHLEGHGDHDSFSVHVSFFKLAFAVFFISCVNYLIIFPAMNYFRPHLDEIVKFFDFSAWRDLSTVGFQNPEIILYIVALILFSPILFIIDWRGKEADEYENRNKKKVKSQSIEEVQKEQQQKQYADLQNHEVKREEQSRLKVICGPEKKAWFDSIVAGLHQKYPGFKVNVQYMVDEEAEEHLKESLVNVWLPDNDLKARDGDFKSIHKETKGYINDGIILKSPLVYVFRKSALKAYLKYYRHVDYRTLIEATRTLKNLTEIDFKYVMPAYDDMSIGTHAMILMMNEHFRTTQSYTGDIYKNKVFMRTLNEYLNCRVENLEPGKSSAFITTEHKGIEFVHSKKGRGWQVVYPTMVLYTDHRFLTISNSPETEFLFNYIISYEVQKQCGAYGWRPGDFSVDAMYSGLMEEWKKYKIPNTLGVHTYMPNFHAVKGMLTVAETALKDDGFILSE